MQWEPQQRETLHRALRATIRTDAALELFVALKLGPNLNDISERGDLNLMVLRVIQWAEPDDKKTETLLTAALESFKDTTEVTQSLPALLELVRVRQGNQATVQSTAVAQLAATPDLQEIVGRAVRETIKELSRQRDTKEERSALQAGTRALEKLSKTGEDTRLTPNEKIGLEAVIVGFSRPVLIVRNGDVDPVPEAWNVLASKHDQIRTVTASVGRIDIDGPYPFAGTGFVAAPGVIATSRHVALSLGGSSRGRWTLRRGRNPRIDFLHEDGLDGRAAFEITKLIGVDERAGIALFAVRATGTDGKKLPPPLSLARQKPRAADRTVYIVGYPAEDSRTPDVMKQVYGGIFGVKRLCPGKTMKRSDKGFPNTIAHDCTTGGGTAGAPLIDLNSGKVLGVHYAAQYLVAGFAKPIAAFQGSELAKKARLQFV